MKIWKARFSTLIILLLFWGCATAQEYSTDVQWLIDTLEITEGATVADIGAGDGDQSIELAQFVGADGQIYSTELGEESLQTLARNIEGSELTNITVVEGLADGTNLPEECCDAIFLRRVYHHIAEPPAFNTSLLASLKPGGRLGIIDFTPRGEEAEPGGRASGDQHGITPDTVIEELTNSGFEVIDTNNAGSRFYYVAFRKPQ